MTQNGILHCHSEYSIRDASMKIPAMVEVAKSLGAPAIALTDHGTLAGIIEFTKECKKNEIKPILGIEAYFEPVEGQNKARHLILMAKNYAGYQAICKAQLEAYENKHNGYPCMNFDILQRHFGAGAKGHDNVIATSACAFGVLSWILLTNEQIEIQLPKLRAKRDKYQPIDDTFLSRLELESSKAEYIKRLMEKRDELKAMASESLTGLRRRLKTLSPDSEEYTSLSKEIEEKELLKSKAAEELEVVKKQIAKAKKEKTELSARLAPIKASAEKWGRENDKIEELLRSAVPESKLKNDAVEMAKALVEIFGNGNFYIELQYHGFSDERKTMPILADIAKELSIPVVATNDAHYPTNSPDDIRARTLIAALRFNQPIDPDIEKTEGYGQNYIKSDAELLSALSEILDHEVAETAIANIGDIVNACDCEMPDDTHYPKFRGGIPGENPEQRLRRLAIEGIPKRYGKKWCKEYEDRMNYELDIINKMGFADYHCIVQDFLEYGRSLAAECPEGVGYTIGPGRGSAVGSIVCYLIGITSVDPMKYGLLFERFLNPERVSMPDIDSDFHTEKRAKVIEYVKQKYGEHAVCNIMTKGTNAGRGAIRAIGRVTNIPDSVVEMVVKQVPAMPNARIADIPNIEQLCDENPLAKQLISDAKLIEGLTVSYGMHAAGVIISDNDDVGEYVALMRNDDGQYVAQCDMGQAEKDCHLLKMDFLGLKNLDIITDTLGRIKKNKGMTVDIEKVPIEADVLKYIFSAGRTNSVFQFESGGMKSMLKRFKPSSMEDLILLVAAYRPGPMQYLDHIIDVKNGKEKPEYIADGLEEILAPTYGYTIYQEQVMQIFNKVANFSLGEADVVRRAMGKKKISILLDPKTNYHGRFIEGLVHAGATEEKAEKFWTELLDFASYAFNKSHAAAYAHVAYYTAWLKYHYPAEYMCSVMCRADFSGLPALLNDCRDLGLTIASPNINDSKEGFINIGNKIIFGFNDVKGMGTAGTAIVNEREAHGKFLSFKDVLQRMSENSSRSISQSAYIALIESGAFDEFSEYRTTLKDAVEPLLDLCKKIKEKQESVSEANELQQTITDATTEKEVKRITRLLKNRENSYEQVKEDYHTYILEVKPDDIDSKLEQEYERLGAYISGSPLDKFERAINAVKNKVNIIDLETSGNVIVCGLVENVKRLNRKKDGKPFCIFTLMDKTGEVEVKCFVKTFEEYGELVQQGAACVITGYITMEKGYDDEDQISVVANIIKQLAATQSIKIAISFSQIATTLLDTPCSLDELLIPYRDDINGCEAYVFNSFGEIQKLNFKLSSRILNAKIAGLVIGKM